MRPGKTLAVVLAVVACSASGPTRNGGTDADGGAGADAGAGAGVGADAGADAGASTDSGADAATGTDAGAGAGVDAGADAGDPACLRASAAADRPRKVVVSHPYADAGAGKITWEVLSLSQGGTLTRTMQTFAMGRAVAGEVVFTPDGEVGLAALDQGEIGVVRFDDAGAPTVVHAAWKGSFSASRLVMAPSGDRAIALDSSWREYGGGLYSIRIACDGTLRDDGLIAAAKLPYALEWQGDAGRAVVAASDVLTSDAGVNAHIVQLAPPSAYVGGVNAFGHNEAIVGSSAMTPDARFVLFGDTNAFSGLGNKVAVAEVNGGTTIIVAQSPLSVEDPVAIIASPFGNSALVFSGFGNAAFSFDYRPSASPPFVARGKTDGGQPLLPSGASAIRVGALSGRVVVAENVGVRQFQFLADGGILNIGLTSFGSGTSAIAGAIGVQP